MVQTWKVPTSDSLEPVVAVTVRSAGVPVLLMTPAFPSIDPVALT